VIDTCSWLATHECRWRAIPTTGRLFDDPIDILGDDLLVRTQIKDLLLTQQIDNVGLCFGSIHNQIQNGVGKGLCVSMKAVKEM
jgi:hypothetical protein